jgi:hypothetical protein
MKFPKVNFFTIAIGAIVLYIAFILIVTYANHFSRTITVKEKSNYGMGKYLKNIVIDTSGKVYTVHAMYLVGVFDAIGNFASLEEGKTYRVSGYGISIPVLQMFPNITQISPA